MEKFLICIVFHHLEFLFQVPLLMNKYLLTLLLLLNTTLCYAADPSKKNLKEIEKKLTQIEQEHQAKIGIAVLDSTNNFKWSFNGDKRFPMMSTFKTLACAKMLKDADSGKLNKKATFGIHKNDLIPWSPVTSNLIGQKISLEKACEATMLTSDNTAANIVLTQIGSPLALTDFMRAIGDKITRLDRFEPYLNQAQKNDNRDTTTPNAMVSSLNSLLFGQSFLLVRQHDVRQQHYFFFDLVL